MKNVNLYITALAILMLFWGCDKGPELTPVTQEGKNTFSCKVNGKVWKPDGRDGVFVVIKGINGGYLRNVTNKGLNINIMTYTSDEQEMDIYLKPINIGKHLLSNTTKRIGEHFNPESYGWYQGANGKIYMTSKKTDGWVNLSVSDTVTGIISGTFAFTASTSSGDIIKVTDGRFDIKSPQ
jgi:hypothetical protein